MNGTIEETWRPHDRTLDWDAAYLLYAPALLRFLRRFDANEATAEDLMQMTFERATRAAHPPRTDELRSWLYRIATNLAIDHLRRRRRIRFVPFAGNERDERSPFDVEADVVRRALRAIPPLQAMTLVLRLHEGLSRADIASCLGISERRVKEHLERGRENFARAYREEVTGQ